MEIGGKASAKNNYYVFKGYLKFFKLNFKIIRK